MNLNHPPRVAADDEKRRQRPAQAVRGGRNNDEPLSCSTNNNERALALPAISDRRSGPTLASTATAATQTVRHVLIGGPERQSLVHVAFAPRSIAPIPDIA